MRDGHAGRGPWALFALAMACVGPPSVRLTVVGPEQEPSPRRDTPMLPRMDERVRPERYVVELTVDPRQEAFSGLAEIEVALTAPTQQLWLRGLDMRVHGASVSARGSTRPARAVREGEDELGFLLERPLTPGPAKLRVTWQGHMREGDASGLQRHQEGGHWYAQTRLRPEDAWRVVPMLAAPSLPPVPWQLTLRMPAEHRAFSEMPVLSEEVGPSGLRIVRFKTPSQPGAPMAFAVGPAAAA